MSPELPPSGDSHDAEYDPAAIAKRARAWGKKRIEDSRKADEIAYVYPESMDTVRLIQRQKSTPYTPRPSVQEDEPIMQLSGDDIRTIEYLKNRSRDAKSRQPEGAGSFVSDEAVNAALWLAGVHEERVTQAPRRPQGLIATIRTALGKLIAGHGSTGSR